MVRTIAIGLAVIAALGAAWYFLAGGGPSQRGARKSVDDLKAALAAAQARGDANAIASLTRQLAEAERGLAASGDTSVDLFSEHLSTCVASFDLVNPVLADISATDRADWLARGNKWRNALHFATDAQACLAGLAVTAESKGDLEKLRAALVSWGTRMRATQNRLYYASHGGESGLDAYSGSPEPGGDDKAHAWLVGVVDPMWATLTAVDHKLSALDPSNAGLTAELAQLSAGTSRAASVFGP